MPSKETIIQAIEGFVVPPLAGALASWLLGTKVIAEMGLTHSTVVQGLTPVLTFGVVTVVTAVFTHNHLSGKYAPAAKEALGRPPMANGGNIKLEEGAVTLQPSDVKILRPKPPTAEAASGGALVEVPDPKATKGKGK